MTAKQAREKTDVVRAMEELGITEQIDSVIKQVEGNIRIGRYSVLINNKLPDNAIKFLQQRYGYSVTPQQSPYSTFLISWY